MNITRVPKGPWKNSEGVAINSSSIIMSERTLIGQRKQQLQPARYGASGRQLRATVCPPCSQQLFTSLPLAVVKSVSSVLSALRAPSLRPHFNARHLARIPAGNHTEFLSGLTAAVRARLKAVSPDRLRIPIRPKAAGYAHTRDTRTVGILVDALTRCRSGVARLDAFFGAPSCAWIRSALPLVVAISPMPCAHSG